MTLKVVWMFVAVVSFVKSSHFRGAFVTWIVDNSAPNYFPFSPYSQTSKVNVRLGMSWRRSDSSGGYCTDQTIRSRQKISTTSWTCNYRNNYYMYSSYSCHSSLSQPFRYYYCDNYNVADDYTVGYNNFTWTPYVGYIYHKNRYYNLSSSSCCWVGGMRYGSSSAWNIEIKINFMTRPDNNSRINSSPQVSYFPVYRVESGQQHTFSLPVWDPDGDTLQCRWAQNFNEGGGIYHFRFANLTENCQFTISGHLDPGWYPVAIMVEDFFTNYSSNGYTNIKLSSIPLQFTFNVNYSSSGACNNYTTLNDVSRKASYYGYTNGCDRSLVKKWYRFTTPGSSKMPEACVPKYSCGTNAPGWLLGQHPTVAQGIVDRTVCYHWGGSCCNLQNNIRIRNCSDFYIYELQRSPGCNMRYCTTGDRNSSVSNVVVQASSSILQPTLALSSTVYFPTNVEKLDGCKYYQILSDYTRAANYNDWSSYRCDKELYGWYRFMGQAGNRMVNFCPNVVYRPYRCGSYYQGWLHGSQPSVNDGSVPRTVCFSPYNSCSCSYSTQVYVKNCKTFYVYWLNDVPTCNSRYCGISDRITEVACSTSSMQVTLDTRYVNYSMYSSITFKDSACSAYYNPSKFGIYLTTSLTSCGTTKTESNNHITYENEVQMTASAIPGQIIVRDMNQKIKVSCSYDRNGKTGITGFKPIPTVNFSQPGFGNFTFNFWMYTSSSYRTRHYVYPVTVQLRDWLYFETSIGSGDRDVFIIVEKCYTTPSLDRNYPIKYTFIKNRCPSDPTVQFLYNHTSNHHRRFSIQAFRFVGNLSAVYVHCEVFLCHRSSTDSRCHHGCHGNNIPVVRRKRRADDDRVNIPSVSDRVDLTTGPFISAKTHDEKEHKSAKADVLTTVIAMGVGVTVLVVVIAGLVIKVAKMKSLAKVAPDTPPNDKYKQRGDRYMEMEEEGDIEEETQSVMAEDIAGIAMKI